MPKKSQKKGPAKKKKVWRPKLEVVAKKNPFDAKSAESRKKGKVQVMRGQQTTKFNLSDSFKDKRLKTELAKFKLLKHRQMKAASTTSFETEKVSLFHKDKPIANLSEDEMDDGFETDEEEREALARETEDLRNQLRDRGLTRREIMENMVMYQKKMKLDRRAENRAQEELREAINQDYKTGVVNQNMLTFVKNADRGPVDSDSDDDFDSIRRKLKGEQFRSVPTDALRTPEAQALVEEKEQALKDDAFFEGWIDGLLNTPLSAEDLDICVQALEIYPREGDHPILSPLRLVLERDAPNFQGPPMFQVLLLAFEGVYSMCDLNYSIRLLETTGDLSYFEQVFQKYQTLLGSSFLIHLEYLLGAFHEFPEAQEYVKSRMARWELTQLCEKPPPVEEMPMKNPLYRENVGKFKQNRMDPDAAYVKRLKKQAKDERRSLRKDLRKDQKAKLVEAAIKSDSQMRDRAQRIKNSHRMMDEEAKTIHQLKTQSTGLDFSLDVNRKKKKPGRKAGNRT